MRTGIGCGRGSAALRRDYLVLSAYVAAFRAAWLFASYGADSLLLNAMDEPAAVHHARR